MTSGSNAPTHEDRIAMVVKAIKLIEERRDRWRDANQDPTKGPLTIGQYERAVEYAENEFGWQWSNVKMILREVGLWPEIEPPRPDVFVGVERSEAGEVIARAFGANGEAISAQTIPRGGDPRALQWIIGSCYRNPAFVSDWVGNLFVVAEVLRANGCRCLTVSPRRGGSSAEMHARRAIQGDYQEYGKEENSATA